MRSREEWKPSKFVYKNGKLIASRNTAEISSSARILADIIAEFYGTQLAIHAKGRLLDLGCGKVPLYQAYKDHVSENICVDWGQSRHKNPYLDQECDLNQKLPFKDGEFDTIILSDVLEHIRYPEQLLAEIFRMLNNKGKLIMNTPFYYWLHEEPHDYFRYTEYALKEFAKDAGFNIISIEPEGGVPLILADIFAKTSQKIPFIGNALIVFIHVSLKIWNRTGFGKKMTQISKAKFPLAYFTILEKK